MVFLSHFHFRKMFEDKLSGCGADLRERVCDNSHDDEVSLMLTSVSAVIEMSFCFIWRFVLCMCL